MADPLSLLKEYLINRKPIVEDGEDIIFGDYAWNRNVLTSYRVWGASSTESNEFYSLDSLLFLVKHQDDAYHSYVKTAISQGKALVRLADKKDLLQYLVHGGAEPKAIAKDVPLDISQRKLVTRKPHTSQEPVPIQTDQTRTTDLDALPTRNSAATGPTSAVPFSLSSSSNSPYSNMPPLSSLDAQSLAKRPRLKTEETVEPASAAVDVSYSSTRPSETSIPSSQMVISSSAGDAGSGPFVGDSSALTQVIPADRLRALRAKIQAKRSMANQGAAGDGVTTSNNTALGEMGGGSQGGMFGVPSSVGGSAASARQATNFTPLGGADSAFIQEILGRERTWRNRINVLDSPGKDFLDTIVNGILRNVKAKEEGRLGGTILVNGKPVPANVAASGAPPTGRNPAPHGAANTNLPSSGGTMQRVGYSRYEQEKFTQEEMAGFHIDTMRTYHGQGLSGMMAIGASGGQSQAATGVKGPPPKSTANPPPQIRDPRISTTQAPQPASGAGGGGAGAGAGGGGGGSTPGTLRSVQEARQLSRTQKGRAYRTPIIIIPAAPTSLITMFNAKDILQNLRYVASEDKKNSGAQRENELLIQRHKADGTTVPYRIVDQPMRLTLEEWDRVVGIFVQGQAWQFKGWPIGQDPSDIFMKVKAFHLRWSRQPLNPNVEKWNVTVINLDERRHLDKANLQQIWDLLDKHISKAKPHLRY